MSGRDGVYAERSETSCAVENVMQLAGWRLRLLGIVADELHPAAQVIVGQRALASLLNLVQPVLMAWVDRVGVYPELSPTSCSVDNLM